MRAEDCVGQYGRTLTEVSATGRIQVAGKSFDAITVGPLIPAGETVRVTGWRLVDEFRRILSVRATHAPELGGTSGLADEFQKLQKLRDAGTLTDAEFTEAKAALLKNPPVRAAEPPATRPASPRCHACEAAATTLCQGCGALSCMTHLQSIYMAHDDGGAYELRCKTCYASAQWWKVAGWVFFAVMTVITLVIWSLVSSR
ncbi:NfeD family protein [Zavarzinella formosa]|uniref:NfeD family protein n=1 Tax=Zavarzinella formosa TaxID=360055 RepID=UPI000316C425|nr:NfeD family protein [Zavarzinella formosa]